MIEAFAGFVMGGNFVIGVIVFAILTIVNFVVITKGSGRIAEVAARFTLDAMPGKQMAIDADLSAGMIDEPEARRRRKELEEESAFFGSMDGASKFVRGDASAGLMITFINVIAGMVIGIAQNDLPFMVAADTYTRLTIGDGLVSQIPALIISVAAGLLVSKAGVSGSADKALFDSSAATRRRSGCRRPCCSRWACCPACRSSRSWRWPGRPGLRRTCRRDARASVEGNGGDDDGGRGTRSRRRRTDRDRPVDRLGPAGAGLRPADADQYGDEWLSPDRPDQGATPPACRGGRIRPAVGSHPGQSPAWPIPMSCGSRKSSGRGDIRPNMLLVMDPRGEDFAAGRAHGGTDVRFTRHVDRAELPRRGAVQGPDRGRCLHRHHNPPDRGHQGQHAGPALLRGDAEAAGRDRAGEPEAGGGRHPGADHHGRLQRVLQNLLGERVDPRPAHHPEGVSEACGFTRNITAITEHVRTRWPARSPSPTPTKRIHPADHPVAGLGAGLRQSIVGEGDDRQLSMAPSRLQQFITNVRQISNGTP